MNPQWVEVIYAAGVVFLYLICAPFPTPNKSAATAPR
jgi:hypothetical protein